MYIMYIMLNLKLHHFLGEECREFCKTIEAKGPDNVAWFVSVAMDAGQVNGGATLMQLPISIGFLNIVGKDKDKLHLLGYGPYNTVYSGWLFVLLKNILHL